MSEQNEKKPVHPETYFLPPLNMVLTFLERALPQKKEARVEGQEKATEQDLEKLIEKLSEKEE